MPEPLVPPLGLELRVHGVHGTSPGDMLGLSADQARQVAGDGLTGIYRPRDGVLVPGRTEGDRVEVEAYSWGALTSGVAGFLGWVVRALWLLLLPFALTNLAFWSRLSLNQGRDAAGNAVPPGRASPRNREWFTEAVVRLSALLLTVFFVLTATFIAVDLFAWQCFRAGVVACPRVPGWLMFVADLRPGRRLALGMVAPVLVVGVLAWLSRSTGSRYEAVQMVDGAQRPGTSGAVLANPTMWSGERDLRRHRMSHVGAAVSTIAGFTGVHAWRMSVDAGHGPDDVLLLVVVLAALGLGAAVLAVVLPTERSVKPTGAASVLAAVALVLLAVTLVLEGEDAYLPYRDVVWHDEFFVAVFVVLTTLHLAVFFADRITRRVLWWLIPVVAARVLTGAATTVFLNPGADLTNPAILTLAAALTVLFLVVEWWHVRQRKVHPASAWNGAASSVLLAAALWVALIFNATAVTASADYLNGPDTVARLVVSSEPYGKKQPPEGADRQISVRGNVVVRPLTDPDGTSGGVSVTADDAWLTRASLQETEADNDVDRRVFHLDSRFLPDAEIRILGGSRVRDLRTGEGVDLRATGRYLQQDADSQARSADVVAPVDLVVRDPGHTALVLPPVLVWAPVAILVWLVLTLAVLAGCLRCFRRRVRPLVQGAGDDLFRSRTFPDAGWDQPPPGAPTMVEVPERDRAAVRAARVSAALAHRAEPLLNWVGVVTAPIAFLMVAVSTTNDWVNLGGQEWFKNSLGVLANLGLFLMIGISLGLVALGARVRADSGWRRHVGILWDLTTFWPRAAHPLAPPCYAERVVPELVTRLRWATMPTTGGVDRYPVVVLSAHSQGTCLAVAALMQLGDPLPGQLRLLTYGSQLRGIYGRVFPRVFGPGVLPCAATTGPTRLDDAFPDVPPEPPAGPPPGYGGVEPLHTLRSSLRWVNLFRRADPLGYRVFSDVCDDGFDRVVMEVPGAAAGDPGPTVQGHSAYPRSPEYAAVVDAWVRTR